MTHPPIPAATVAPRTANPVQPTHRTTVARMLGLETAANMLGGQVELADALGIKARSLRSKFTAERGVSNADLHAAADALDARAARVADHARKLRDEAGGRS